MIENPLIKLILISLKNKQKSNLIDTCQLNKEGPFDEYGVQESKDEYDVDTQSLEGGLDTGEEINTTHHY